MKEETTNAAKEEKKPSVQSRIGSLLATAALVISMILCLTVVVQVITNGYVQIGGISLFRVVTGSMEPTLPVGSLLVCQQTDISEIRQDDIVCFRSRNPQIMGKIVTHRVVAVMESGDGGVLLETKGDANLSADGEFVTKSNLIGRVNHYAKDGNLMASVVNIMSDRIGFLMLILFPTLLIAGFVLRSCINSMQRDIARIEDEKRREEQEKANLYTQQEYADMLERIREEILAEMKQDVGTHEEATGDPKTE